MIWVGRYINCLGCGRRMPDIGKCAHDLCVVCCHPCQAASNAETAKYIHEGPCTTSSGIIVESIHCARCSGGQTRG